MEGGRGAGRLENSSHVCMCVCVCLFGGLGKNERTMFVWMHVYLHAFICLFMCIGMYLCISECMHLL